jgi:hypothetical protein
VQYITTPYPLETKSTDVIVICNLERMAVYITGILRKEPFNIVPINRRTTSPTEVIGDSRRKSPRRTDPNETK